MITGDDNYFEDFETSTVYSHARGRTVTEMDNVLITHMTMNTAQAHFNEQSMADTDFGQRLVFGGVTASIVLGLASQDTGEQVEAEVGMSRIRFTKPVFHGDTLRALTEVLAVEDVASRSDVGLVRFRHYGVNQHDHVVVEIDREVHVARRTATRSA